MTPLSDAELLAAVGPAQFERFRRLLDVLRSIDVEQFRKTLQNILALINVFREVFDLDDDE